MTGGANRPDPRAPRVSDETAGRAGENTSGRDREQEPPQRGHEQPCAPGSEALRPLARALLAAAAAEVGAGRADLHFRADGASIDQPRGTGTAKGA